MKFEIYFRGLPLEIVFGVWCNKSNEINPTKRFSLEPEKTTFKRNEDFTCVFSIPVKFIYFLGLPLEIVFGVITDHLLHL